MISGNIIETDRLYLREMMGADFPALCLIMQDADVMYDYNGTFTDEGVRAWLGRHFARYATLGFGLWAVVLCETGEMIGQCGLTMQDWDGWQVLEVGYLFQKAFWHKGYATEAARACRDYAFETLDADEVFSIISDGNKASRKVAERNGMNARGEMTKNFRGVDKTFVLYSIRRER